MTAEAVLAAVAARFPGVRPDASPVKSYPTLRLSSPADLVPLASFLRDEHGFSYLEIVTATDWLGPVSPAGYPRAARSPHPFPADEAPPAPPARTPGVPYRPAFDLLWCVANIPARLRLFLRLEVPRDNPSVPSLTPLFKAADWQERETFDLLGIKFEGHPNLAKILTPDFLVGHPLRKDYAHVKDRFDD